MNNNEKNQNSQTLASIAKSSIASIESAIGALNNLVENIKIYKQCMIDSINLQAENQDSGSTNAVGTRYQYYNLPGVLQTDPAYYLQGIKPDGERMEEINATKEKALKQKRIFFRLVEKDSRHYFQALKGLQHSDASFEEFIEILNGNIDLSLQPNKLANRPDKTQPSIKLSIDQKPTSK